MSKGLDKKINTISPSSGLAVTKNEEVKGMSVGVYINMALMSPPLELHCAHIIDLMSRGNKVKAYICEGALGACTANPFGRQSICNFCAHRSKQIVKKTGVASEIIRLDSARNDLLSEEAEEEFDIGVMSSLASMTRAQSHLELSPKWAQARSAMLSGASRLYSFFCEKIRKDKPDIMYMFNGRFGCVRPARMAASENRIGYAVYDVKKSLHEVVFLNESLHSISANTRKAVLHYEKFPEQCEEQARAFFGKKISGNETGDKIYTADQEKGALPNIIDKRKKLIVVYTSSDDEYRYIGGEWDGDIPEDQVDEIRGLARGLDWEKYQMVIRMHPNQAMTPSDTRKRYIELSDEFKGIHVEAPDSRVDTYALLRVLDICVTFCSTIGVEACYARKPVVLIGSSPYERMDVGITVPSGEAASCIINEGIEPRPIKGAIIWGAYLSNYKDPLPAYSRVNNGNYLVNGEKIGNSRLLRILQLPAKLEIERNKPGFKWNWHLLNRVIDVVGNVARGTWAVK